MITNPKVKKAYLLMSVVESLRALDKIECNECITQEYIESQFEVTYPFDGHLSEAKEIFMKMIE